MAYQEIGLGTSADDGTGDTLRAAGTKTNANDTELYSLLGGTGISGDSGGSASAGATLTSPTIVGATSATGVVTFSAVPVFSAGATATAITIADESSDTTCFPLFATAATGDLGPKSGTNLTFNSSSGVLTATGFAGPITGAVTGNADTATALATARTIGGTSFDGTGNIAVALASVGTAVTVADESSDTTCFPLFATAATGDLGPKSGSNLTFNSASGLLTATGVTADLTGTFGVDLGSDAEGDIYYRNSSGNFVRLARGTDNHVLTMNGNVPNWEEAGGGGGMYSWVTNMTADVETSDISNTANGVFTVGSGITVTLAAGDEIAVQIGEIYVESSDTGESDGAMGIYDGTTFYMFNSQRLGAVGNGMVEFPPSSNDPDTITSGIYTEGGGNVKKSMPSPLIFSQKALNLSTSQKTWKLAFKHTNGTGIKIVGTTLARWAMGVRRET